MNVLSRREDGYHNIETVFFRLGEPSDEIEVSDAEEFQITCTDSKLPTDTSNIIVKTIQACAELHGETMPPLHIHLQKHLPMGAGIGGGSANAATAIDIYSEYVHSLDSSQKQTIAEKVGADVPFFVSGYQAAIGSGKGEILRPLIFPMVYSILLVKLDDIFISTKEAYENIDRTKEKRTSDLSFVTRLPIDMWRTYLTNDFEPFAFDRFPQLSMIKEMMYLHGAEFALMSGSGSLIYGIFENSENALTLQREFSVMFPGAFTSIVKTQ